MKLSDGVRHKLATLVALGSVLAGYYGLGLDVVVAVALAAGLYAVLLWAMSAAAPVAAPAPAPESDTLTAEGSAKALGDAADRVDQAARHVPGDDRRVLILI